MPVIHIIMNTTLDNAKKQYLLKSIADLFADKMNKPKSDVMVIYDQHDFIMASTFDPAVFIDFRIISGFQIEKAKLLCAGIRNVLNQVVLIDPARMYFNFFEVQKIHAWRFVNGEPVCPESRLENHL